MTMNGHLKEDDVTCAMFERWLIVLCQELFPCSIKKVSWVSCMHRKSVPPRAVTLYHMAHSRCDLLHEWADFDCGRLQERMSGIFGLLNDDKGVAER